MVSLQDEAGQWVQYTWLVVVGAIVAFISACGIGANDVANSFGTSVGAKTLTLLQACIVASFCEFGGAVALGGQVTKTIAGNIARPQAFDEDPEIFAYGMLCSLVAASAWVYVATYAGLAVSTTHSIVGAILGFALVWQGSSAVVWNDKTDSFPYREGLMVVVVSWFTSPILSCVAAAGIFLVNRTLILRSERAASLAVWGLPPLLGVTVMIGVFFVLYKGAEGTLDWTSNHAAWVAGICAAGAFLVALFPGIYLLKWRVHQVVAKQTGPPQAKVIVVEFPSLDGSEEVREAAGQAAGGGKGGLRCFLWKGWAWIKACAMHGLTQDVHAGISKDADVAAMHQAAEVFDPQAEIVYQYLQIFSACCVSFTHGANDVANAVGPFAAIWYVYNHHKVSTSVATPEWILALGGAGIVLGLGTYGYNVIASLGVKMAKMTAARGYCAELATSLTVAVASTYGLPISTTHCIVGAEVGVGMCESVRRGANWRLFARTVTSWVFTMVVTGLLSAALFAQGVYSPSVAAANDTHMYEQTLNNVITKQLLQPLNATNAAYRSNSDLSTKYNASLEAHLESIAANLSSLFDVDPDTQLRHSPYVPPKVLLQLLVQALGVYGGNAVLAPGYNTSEEAVGQLRTPEAVTVPCVRGNC